MRTIIRPDVRHCYKHQMELPGNVRCRVGCAGWNLPKEMRLNGEGSNLEQYARVFNCVEINSSFYRHHQFKTYERWAAAVPENFQFSVKAPKSITHTRHPFADTLERLFDETEGLGTKLAVLLLQFPPKREFDRKFLNELLKDIRTVFKRKVVCEPRHPSWFEPRAVKLLNSYSVSIVIADPQVAPNSPEIPSADDGAYLRLHGAPRRYYSEYSPEFISELREMEALQAADSWVIFDNTAIGRAYGNARDLLFGGNVIAAPGDASLGLD